MQTMQERVGTAHESIHRAESQCERLCPPYKACRHGLAVAALVVSRIVKEGKMHRLLSCSTSIVAVACALAPATARDLTYTVRKGQEITIGPWYHIGTSPCRMIEVPRITTIEKPQLGVLATSTSPGKPERPEQLKACPNLTVTQVNATYKASQSGTDAFSFLLEYKPALSGDWLYNVTVQVVDVPQ